jgi:mannosyltransferase OCH1-like enzyme
MDKTIYFPVYVVILFLIVFIYHKKRNWLRARHFLRTERAAIYPETSSTKIPTLIHQTWKTSELPDNFKKWSDSIKKFHPDWDYILWTDEDNWNFINDHYSWFLPIYESYNQNIKRVDAVRYFYLYHYGGLYADLDFECLRPIDQLVQGISIAFGKMGDGMCSNCIPNAIMMSVPKHKFWLFVIEKMIARVNTSRPEYETGPILLKECIDSYTDKKNITLFDCEYFYPIDWTTKKGQWYRSNIPANPREEFQNSYFVTYWTHTW